MKIPVVIIGLRPAGPFEPIRIFFMRHQVGRETCGGEPRGFRAGAEIVPDVEGDLPHVANSVDIGEPAIAWQVYFLGVEIFAVRIIFLPVDGGAGLDGPAAAFEGVAEDDAEGRADALYGLHFYGAEVGGAEDAGVEMFGLLFWFRGRVFFGFGRVVFGGGCGYVDG